MKRALLYGALTPLIAAVTALVTATAASASVWSSSAQYASWSNGGYTLYNDVWGSGAGPQTIWANSYSNWGVSSDQPNTSGVKSFPNDTRYIGASLSSLSSVTSSFSVTNPGSGAFETAYDIWDSSNAYETMLWMNKTGAVGPLGSEVASVSVGGYSWHVYKGSNGSNQVFSFVNTGSATSGTVNILAVLKWIESQGWFGNITLGNVQFGWEITSTSGTENFQVNSFSVSG